MSQTTQDRHPSVARPSEQARPVAAGHRLWSNPLWEVFGDYSLVQSNGQVALKIRPGHDKAPGVFAFIAAAFGYAALLTWMFLGVQNPFDLSTSLDAYIPWIFFTGTLVFGGLATWNILTLTASTPRPALVPLSSPPVATFAKETANPRTGRLSNSDGRVTLDAQLRAPEQSQVIVL